MGTYKKVTSHGSIGIPAAMRRDLMIEAKDPMEVTAVNGSIVITPYIPRCHFCGGTEEVRKFKGRHVCRQCVEEITGIITRQEGGEG